MMKIKKAVRIVGAFATLLVLAFPPWVDARPGIQDGSSVGRHAVWEDPVNSRVNTGRLAVEVGGILGAALLLTFGQEDAE